MPVAPTPFRALSGALAAALAAFAWTGPAQALESPWDDQEFAAMRLIGAADAHNGAGAGAPYAAGLEFRLADDWKIYWRAPGDAGFPPRLDFSASDNLRNAEIRWPVPVRFSIFGLETLGYKHHVVLPLLVTAEDPAKPVTLAGSVEYLACSDICVPLTAKVAMTVPPGAGGASSHAQEIARFDARVPDAGTAMGLDVRAVTLSPDPERVGAGTLAVAVGGDPALGETADVFFEGPPGLAYGKPTIEAAPGGGSVLRAPVDGLQYLKTPLIGTRITALVVDGERAAEATLAVAEAGADPSAPLVLWPILGLALLGGLILNLMPCVLPVLSIKLLGVVSHGGRETGRVRLHFLASAAGIVTSFLALAGALIAVKQAGLAVGWGIQFQQPWFLVAMALIVVAFACNLFGFFEIKAPDAVADAAAHGAGHAHQHGGLGGDFLAGMLATLLATPCSAPFVGTAVGFALAAGAFDILAVFAALGLGLALPYLTIAAAPGLVTRLPRPGPWMVKLRIVLGFALLATAAWLLWVLAGVVGALAALTAALFAAAVGLLLWLRGRMGDAFQWPGLAALLAAAMFAFAAPVLAPAPPDASAGAAMRWAAFDEGAIRAAVADGRVVFVDVTADWCITCKANKSLVLDRDPVLGALNADTVVTMQADWTRPDAAIAGYLASFRRYGIPFNAVYGPGAPDGIALPELLTPDAVLGALAEARG